MDVQPPPVLATVWRGDVPEARIRGHVVVVDAAGRIRSSVGDPQALTTLRSCVKPLQALPFVRLAADRLGADEAEVAIACASHQGEDVHVATVRGLLAKAGVPESALGCGPQLPSDEATARRLLASGGTPLPIHNNCSGKHAAMLSTCAVMGWPLDGYLDPAHPCQLAVAAAMSEAFDLDLASAPRGIDGCGLTTYGTPLATIARGFAAASADSAFRRCQDAMASNPHLVAGTGRFDTALLAAMGTRLTAKIGGAAVWAAVLRPRGHGIAIKLESGTFEAIPVVATAVLQRLGVLDAELPDALRPFAGPPLRNWAGMTVGETSAETEAMSPLTPAHAWVPFDADSDRVYRSDSE
ncbi:MAG TPA: asparaginase [Candidatus Acidoferrales bacterium]|nr:asparaginase [Candidatus Acidoferrales bacterium]